MSRITNWSRMALVGWLVVGGMDVSPLSAQESYDRNNRRGVFRESSTASTSNQAATPTRNTATPQQTQASGNRQVSGTQPQARQRGVGPGGTVTAQGQTPGQGRRNPGQPNQAAAGVPGRPGGQPGQPTQVGGASGSRGGQGSGGASGFTMTGKITEVSKGMAESLRTRRVDFDSKQAGESPNVILLGPRRSQPDTQAPTGRGETRLVRPL